MTSRITKTAAALEPGDVIELDRTSGWVVVLESSDHVGSAPPDARFHFGRRSLLASQCCEPRIGYLGKTKRLTHRLTYIIVPKTRAYEVRGFLDLGTQGAIPEMFY